MGMREPSVDEIAVAIVTACRETGENPFNACDRSMMGVKARHYAMHALRKVYPECDVNNLALCVGCPGKPNHFWHNSCKQIAHPTGHSSYTAHWWRRDRYDRVVLAVEAAKTARAVGAPVRSLPKSDPQIDGENGSAGQAAAASPKSVGLGNKFERDQSDAPAVEPKRPAGGNSARARSAAAPAPRPTAAISREERIRSEARRAEQAIGEDGGRARFSGLGAREYSGHSPENKGELYRMLAEAAANTAKMTTAKD